MDEHSAGSRAHTASAPEKRNTRARNRGSRGKGLRVRTGCAACKARHLKCDETRPSCRACQKSARQCIYPTTAPPPPPPPPPPANDNVHARGRQGQRNSRNDGQDASSREANVTATSPIPASHSHPSPSPSEEPGNSVVGDNADAIEPSSGLDEKAVDFDANGTCPGDPPPPQDNLNTLSLHPDSFAADHPDHEDGSTQQDATGFSNVYDAELFGISPGSCWNGWPSISAEDASRLWFELLASDVTNRQFLFPSEQPSHEFQDATIPSDHDQVVQYSAVEHAGATALPTASYLSTGNANIGFSQLEIGLLHHFVTRLSGWIDTTDPDKKFSVVVPHMALSNQGLASAILALSARHLSLNPLARTSQTPLPVDQTMAVQHYNDTLSYLQREMANPDFLRSDELLATVLIISTYEMIDGPGISWEKHLKGVFWIQRSQLIHGESEGLKKRIWWAWLRQDIWAAFRKRRRILSFYKVTLPCASLDFWELVDRAVYILGQCVNYASEKEEDNGRTSLQRRLDHSAEMWEKLQECWLCFEKYNRRLPALKQEDSAFDPIWVTPPAASLAIQVHHFAQIILLEYTPAVGGLKELTGRQISLQKSVDVVCGVATCTTEDGPTIVSMQCVFGAGQHVTDPSKRTHILKILQAHRQQTGWPHSDIADELTSIWTTQDGV